MASANGNDLGTMAGIWKMLDEMSLNNPKEYQKLINDVMKDGKENNMGPPVPHYAVKIKKIPKVLPEFDYFINVCGWLRIGNPSTSNQQIKCLASEFRKENHGEKCVYITDALLSEAVFDEKNSKIFQREKIIELVISCIEEKTNFKFSRKYTVCDEKYVGNRDNLLDFICPSPLKDSLTNGNKNVKVPAKNDGDSPSQSNGKSVSNIETRTQCQPHLKELRSKKLKNNANKEKEKSSFEKPKFEMLLEQKNVEFRIYLPNVTSVSECDLRVTETSLHLLVDEKYELNISLPLPINKEGLGAKFIKDEELLSINTTLK